VETELYRKIMDMLYESGLTKRNFIRKYDIPRGWFMEFTNITKGFRPLNPKTISMLKNKLGIDPIICEKYNLEIKKEREAECTQSEF